MSTSQSPYRRKFRKGAVRAASLVEKDVRRVGESRGFAVSRLLTQWEETVGHEFARLCRPVDIKYKRRAKGETGNPKAEITVLAKGAVAPMLQMQLKQLIHRINACYGYEAVTKVHITQTAPTGFGEETPAAPRPLAPPPPDPVVRAEMASVGDPELRAALERLGMNVRSETSEKESR